MLSLPSWRCCESPVVQTSMALMPPANGSGPSTRVQPSSTVTATCSLVLLELAADSQLAALTTSAALPDATTRVGVSTTDVMVRLSVAVAAPPAPSLTV